MLHNQPKAKAFLLEFKTFLKRHFESFSPTVFSGELQLLEAMKYSTLSDGKYFRPLLAFATAESLSIKSSVILPWATAIEVTHVASLIHDDLPCMDNSLQRRGKASCHRRFGENIALLAGDALWIEAFRIISLYGKKSQTTKTWLNILSESIGFKGLMGGQALDLKPPLKADKLYYQKMHFMKTGALIVASIKGVTALKKIKSDKILNINKVAYLIGEAFQLADDLQDDDDKKAPNFARQFGKENAKNRLYDLSHQALKLISFDKKNDKTNTSLLKKLIIFNKNRVPRVE